MRRGRIGFWFRLAVVLIKPTLTVFLKRDWRGMDNIPKTGGLIVAANHISYADPFPIAHFVYDAGRLPRFLAKAQLFRTRFVHRVMKGAGQIPVERYTADASAALQHAVAALERGECLVVYPEGTITKDPTYWPMLAKTGIARLVLLSGAPVVPVAQWGAQDLYGRDKKLRLLPRKTHHAVAGPPIDLSRYAGAEPTAATLREITDVIMGEIRKLLSEIRGEPVPTEVFDPHGLLPSHERRTA